MDVPSLIIIASLLLVSCVVIFFVVSGLMHYFNLHEPAKISGRRNRWPGRRNIQAQTGGPAGDGSGQTPGGRRVPIFDSYGWIDRKSGMFGYRSTGPCGCLWSGVCQMSAPGNPAQPDPSASNRTGHAASTDGKPMKKPTLRLCIRTRCTSGQGANLRKGGGDIEWKTCRADLC